MVIFQHNGWYKTRVYSFSGVIHCISGKKHAQCTKNPQVHCFNWWHNSVNLRFADDIDLIGKNETEQQHLRPKKKV